MPIVVENLRVVRGSREAASRPQPARPPGPGRRGCSGRAAGGKSTLMRAIVGGAGRRRGPGERARRGGRVARPAPPGRLRHAVARASTATCRCATTSGYFARSWASAGCRRPRHRVGRPPPTTPRPSSRTSVGGQQSRVSLACTLVATRRCWCSTSRRSGSTRCSGASCGGCSTDCRQEGRTCSSQPRHGRGGAVRPVHAAARGSDPQRLHAAGGLLERTGTPDAEPHSSRSSTRRTPQTGRRGQVYGQ